MAEGKKLSFSKNILISGEISCKTGLHIGRSREELEIGGMDNPVIINPKTEQPIIPGSSLKGKLRSLLELQNGSYSSNGLPHSHKKGEECDNPECKLCTIFGNSTDIDRGPSRLIVRDSFVREEVELEIKTENVINRLKGKAENPRPIERVPAGTEFSLDMVYSIYNKDDIDNLKVIFELMNNLHDSYLGGSGSRGYGKIEFSDISFKVRRKKDYIEGKDGEKISINEKEKFTVAEILQSFNQIKEMIEK